MTKRESLLAGMILSFVLTSTADAYVDPGVTGLIFQFGYAIIIAVVAWFAGLGSVFKRMFRALLQKGNNNETSKDVKRTGEEDA